MTYDVITLLDVLDGSCTNLVTAIINLVTMIIIWRLHRVVRSTHRITTGSSRVIDAIYDSIQPAKSSQPPPDEEQ